MPENRQPLDLWNLATQQRRFFDVWILETNTVYRDVPFTVVTDWAQQGRLLPQDNLRMSGSKDWVALGDIPAFAAFLPHAEPFQAEDTAEALEAIHGDIVVHRRPSDDDEDVDMIPLIDISLVLLIFFVMTAAVGGGISSLFNTPRAEHKLISSNPDIYWIGMKQDSDGQILYSFGKGEGDKSFQPTNDRAAMLDALNARLADEPHQVEINIQADQDLPFEAISDLMEQLVKFRREGKVSKVFGGVREKEGL